MDNNMIKVPRSEYRDLIEYKAKMESNCVIINSEWRGSVKMMTESETVANMAREIKRSESRWGDAKKAVSEAYAESTDDAIIISSSIIDLLKLRRMLKMKSKYGSK